MVPPCFLDKKECCMTWCSKIAQDCYLNGHGRDDSRQKPLLVYHCENSSTLKIMLKRLVSGCSNHKDGHKEAVTMWRIIYSLGVIKVHIKKENLPHKAVLVTINAHINLFLVVFEYNIWRFFAYQLNFKAAVSNRNITDFKLITIEYLMQC